MIGSQHGAEWRCLRPAVAAAGDLALRHFHTRPGHWFKGPGQVVTAADLEIDRLLHEALLGAFPDDGWLSEERPDDRARLRRRRVWVVDPIDGTRAFADGLPEFSISVALLVDDAPVLGVVCNPATGEWFEAERGCGAWLDGARLRVGAQRTLAGARLLSSRTEMRRRRWPELIPEAVFTDLSSLAYKLALVAAGRFDGLVSLRASYDWDLAAAQLLITEASGRLSAANGAALALNRPIPRHQGLAAAATGPLHEALIARLAPAREVDPGGRSATPGASA
ncbi:MAG: inositol monophosphatase family protein [Geminicoccaceae bacterium]